MFTSILLQSLLKNLLLIIGYGKYTVLGSIKILFVLCNVPRCLVQVSLITINLKWGMYFHYPKIRMSPKLLGIKKATG